MTISQFVEDAEALIRNLLLKFGQSQLFLVGHSWGSIIGFKIAQKVPALLAAYIGIGQIINMEKGERLSYQFTLEEAKRRGDRKAMAELR